MLHTFSRKHLRDQAMFARWDAMDDHHFEHVSRERLKAIQLGLQGRIVLPGSPDYDADRKLFNPVFDSYPVAIVYCEVEFDVELALVLALEVPLPFTVRSGGHCTAGFSAGYGVLIDVSGLDDVTIDAANLVATVGTGTTFGKFDSLLASQGLHVPGGECPDVCVGGFIQGGGYGFTSVTYGMSCDNVIDMRVMLADGRVVTASDSVNADLFWAMRGGTGGNFGILLSLRYRLRALGDVYGWALIWPLQGEADFENATTALMTLQSSYMLGALSPQLNIQVSLCFQPGTQLPLPADPTLAPYLMVRGVYIGTQSDGEAAIAQLVNSPGAILQWARMDSFYDLNTDLLNEPYSMPWFPPKTPMPCEDKASRYVTRPLAASEWRGLLDLYVTSPNTWSYFYMEFYGGAINAYPAWPEPGNAFVHRTAAFNAVMDVFWFDEAGRAASEAFLEQWIALMEPMWNGEIYQNYVRPEQPNYAAAYWAGAQAGLYAVKCKYDPRHDFRFAQEVCPLMPPGHGVGPVIILPAWLQQALEQPIVVATRPPVGAGQAGRRTGPPRGPAPT